jgi:pimeloyl-ACP methyl ester carboxylesterase
MASILAHTLVFDVFRFLCNTELSERNRAMSRHLPNLILLPPAVFGVAVLALAAALAAPLHMPPPLASIHAGAMNIDQADKPPLSRFQARDGTWLAYRLYPAADGATDRLAIIAHGSSASSDEMHVVARTLAKNGIAAVAVDERGHGASGTRGDIAYVGQLDDDLADLVAQLRKSYANARLTLIGHSAGGGFALRIAGGPTAGKFDRFVLLAPYLGYFAPTNRPNEGAGRWVEPDFPRIFALKGLGALGVDWLQSLPVIGFANAPEAARFVTSQYSYRLLMNYGPPTDWQRAFQASAGRIQVIAGENDELMDAPAYKTAVEPLGAKVTLLPDVDHIGIVYRPAALAAIVAAVK